jgi:hypothetical protein
MLSAPHAQTLQLLPFACFNWQQQQPLSGFNRLLVFLKVALKLNPAKYQCTQ